jgi:transglutaminase/protease-like cytokinesis protein 3
LGWRKRPPVRNDPAGNAAALAESLTKGLTSDSLKVNAFFDWITANVGYDVSVFQPGNRINPELQRTGRVLQTGKAVCQGYANLFYDLCRHAGIPVRSLKGYCRYSLQNPEQLQLHAWNAVKVNGQVVLGRPHLGHGLPRPGHRASTCRRPTGLFS